VAVGRGGRLWKYTRVERRFRVLSGETVSRTRERERERERERAREAWKRARIRVRGEGGNERRAKESVWSTARRGILRQRYVRGDLAVAVTCQRKRRKEAERGEGGREREERPKPERILEVKIERVSGASLGLKHGRLRQRLIRPGPRA